MMDCAEDVNENETKKSVNILVSTSSQLTFSFGRRDFLIYIYFYHNINMKF
jgi:hypothetical protein